MIISRTLIQGFPIRALRLNPHRFLATQTKGQAPPASRSSIEHTPLDQNPHLKHATTSKGGDEGRDKGKGNAAPDPYLPSKSINLNKEEKKSKSLENHKGKRGFHSSTFFRAEDSKESQLAENYFKEVDTTPPDSTKTYRVDGGHEETHRPNEQYANPNKEYATVSHEEPYEPTVEDNGSGSGRESPDRKSQKLRYGGVQGDLEKNAPSSDEGPDKKDAGRVENIRVELLVNTSSEYWDDEKPRKESF